MLRAFTSPGSSISARILLIVVGTLVLAQLASAYFIRRLISEHIVGQKLRTVEILTTSILHDITYSSDRDLQSSGQQIVAKYMTYYRVISDMALYDADSLSVAASNQALLQVRTTDSEILDALTRAKPSLHVTRPDPSNFGIRSVAPILQGSRIVGAVVLDVSMQDIKATLASIDRHIATIMGVALALVAVALWALLRRSVLVRLRRLMDVTRELTAGNYVIRVDDGAKDELGQLTRAFNQMASDLSESRRQIESYNRDLEARVQLATSRLQQTYEDLKNAQGQLVLNEKMASLGGLIAGVAHEINTPVGAILNVSRTLDKHLRAFPHNLELLKRESDLAMDLMVECLESMREGAAASREPVSLREQRGVEAALREGGVARWQERSAALARFNLTDCERIRRYLPCIRSDAFFEVAESYASIAQAGMISQTSSQKIAEIVRALKYYAYSDNARVDMVQINDSIATALVLLRSQLKHTVITSTVYDSDLPLIPCTSDIHQVWTNLLTNACDAIAERGEAREGRIAIRTRRVGAFVATSVTDNGVGIPPAALDRIFDPFFTTKDIGKGTGLGLSIVSGIVKRHGGTIQVESEPGRTTFEVLLPVEQAATLAGRQEDEDERPAA